MVSAGVGNTLKPIFILLHQASNYSRHSCTRPTRSWINTSIRLINPGANTTVGSFVSVHSANYRDEQGEVQVQSPWAQTAPSMLRRRHQLTSQLACKPQQYPFARAGSKSDPAEKIYPHGYSNIHLHVTWEEKGGKNTTQSSYLNLNLEDSFTSRAYLELPNSISVCF